MGTPTTTEQEQGVQPSNDAPTDTTMSPNKNVQAELNILDILEDEKRDGSDMPWHYPTGVQSVVCKNYNHRT